MTIILTLVTHIMTLMSDVFAIVDGSRYDYTFIIFFASNDDFIAAIFNSLLSIVFLLGCYLLVGLVLESATVISVVLMG